MTKIANRSLYLIISEPYGLGRSALEIAERAIAGGVDIIQMRQKDKSRNELVKLGRSLSGLCRAGGVTFIVNDDPLLAAEVDADGVHLGQEDIKHFTLPRARAIVGPDRIIGLSTSSVPEVEQANAEGIDYIAFGPVFPTKLKDRCVGTGDVEKVLATARKPLFFIGGITISNLDLLMAKGASNIAVARAVLEEEDIVSAVKKLKEKLGGRDVGKAA